MNMARLNSKRFSLVFHSLKLATSRGVARKDTAHKHRLSLCSHLHTHTKWRENKQASSLNSLSALFRLMGVLITASDAL